MACASTDESVDSVPRNGAADPGRGATAALASSNYTTRQPSPYAIRAPSPAIADLATGPAEA